MYLYIVSGETYKRSPKVTLDFERCLPSCGAYMETGADPAQWFKVLVVGSVLLDCENKSVYWTYDEIVQSSDKEALLAHFRNQERLLNCSSQDLDPHHEEFFQAARDVFTKLSSDNSVCDKLSEVHEDIVKLVHVFILPEITFRRKDLALVKAILDRIENKEYENIEMLIQMNVEMKKTKEELLSKKRRIFFKDKHFEMILERSRSSKKEFLKILLTHLQKDKRKLESACLCSHVSKKTQIDASELLDDVAVINVDIQQLKMVNELETTETAIKEALYIIEQSAAKAKTRKRFVKDNSESQNPTKFEKQIEEYVKESKELDSFVSEINHSINTKIRLASIREATVLACGEIENEGSSFGYHFMKGSKEMGVDILAMVEKPKNWFTLNDKIMQGIRADCSKYKTEHDFFCSKVKTKCNALLEGYCLVNSVVYPAREHNDGRASRRFSTCWLKGSIDQEECKRLCKDVIEHTEKMTDLFEQELNGTCKADQNLHKNVYICYETCLSEEIMPSLSEVFEQSFQSQCDSLSQWMTQFASQELDENGLTMSKLFQNNNDDKIGSDTDKNTEYDAQIEDSFHIFFKMIQELSNILPLFGKVRKLTDATRFLSARITELRRKWERSYQLCTDDMLDILVLLLCKLERCEVLRLYAHVNLCLNLSPPFLQGSINEFSLITIVGAFQHLFERQSLYESSKERKTER